MCKGIKRGALDFGQYIILLIIHVSYHIYTYTNNPYIIPIHLMPIHILRLIIAVAVFSKKKETNILG